MIRGAVAHIDCTLEAVHPGGDHVIVVGRVRELDVVRDDVGEKLRIHRIPSPTIATFPQPLRRPPPSSNSRPAGRPPPLGPPRSRSKPPPPPPAIS
jgi:hypothetical protein